MSRDDKMTSGNSASANEVKNEGRKLPKPYLLTRMSAALFDFIIVVALFALFQTLMVVGLYQPLGYYTALDEAHVVLSDSNLYVYDHDRGYLTLTQTYDEDKTPTENYDPAITYFYTNDARAIAEDKLTEYYQAKIDSTYFNLGVDEIPVLKDGVDSDELKAFYQTEYSEAVNFLEEDPVYVAGLRRTFYITLFTALGSVTLAAGAVYLLVPLLRRNGDTPMQMLFKLCLADATSDTSVKRRQIVFRFGVLLLFNIWLPILLYARFAYFTLVPIFITLILMSVTRSYRGPHDFASGTYIVSCRDIVIPKTREPEIIEQSKGIV